jgi:transposase
MARKGHPVEFRRRALDLVAAGKSVAEVARLLEVSDQSIYTWRRQELIDRGELPGLSSAEREELRAARRRIRELETELAVHRRACECREHRFGLPAAARPCMLFHARADTRSRRMWQGGARARAASWTRLTKTEAAPRSDVDACSPAAE